MVSTVGALMLALPVGVACGVALGWWCRRSIGQVGVSGVLAEVGAPWILTAFIAGALVLAVTTGRASASPLTAVVAGAVAGASALVVATVIYYGPARTGRLDLDVTGAGSRTAVWAVAGFGVGVLCGALGGLWWSARSRAVALVCAVLVGTALTSEAYYLLDAGMVNSSARGVFVALAVVGIALPLVNGLRWSTVAAMAAVAVLAFPGSLVAEVVWHGTVDAIYRVSQLRG